LRLVLANGGEITRVAHDGLYERLGQLCSSSYADAI
jgi:hypothetical protein